jgi:hypothetical protein
MEAHYPSHRYRPEKGEIEQKYWPLSDEFIERICGLWRMKSSNSAFKPPGLCRIF